MSTNYERGRSAEYRAMRDLEKAGYTVVRSSGSHGPFDVVAVNRLEIRLIQVKRTEGGRLPDLKAAREELARIAVPENAVKEIWVWKGKKGWIWREVVQANCDKCGTGGQLCATAHEKSS